MTGFAYVVGLIIYQLGMLLSGQGFGIGTVIAVIALAGILFQLFAEARDHKEAIIDG